MLADSFLERNGTLFQILATAIGLALTGLGGWWLRSRNKKSKTFDYRVVSDLPILSHRPDDNELKVMYLDEELVNPRVMQVKFVNSGTEVIRASEVLEQYVLEVRDARLVSVSICDLQTVAPIMANLRHCWPSAFLPTQRLSGLAASTASWCATASASRERPALVTAQLVDPAIIAARLTTVPPRYRSAAQRAASWVAHRAKRAE